MGMLKVRMKIHEHEFEAHGPHDIVQAELTSFKNLIANDKKAAANDARTIGTPLDIGRIMQANGRLVFLKIRNMAVDDAVLLLLWGHRQFRSVVKVTGSEIMDGLRVSGLEVKRIDYLLPHQVNEGNMQITGRHRRKRYELTDQGFGKAEQLVQTLLSRA